MNTLHEIEQKLLIIRDIVARNTMSTPNYGLLSGLGGRVLFLYHYENIYGLSSAIKVKDVINNVLSSVQEFPETNSFCGGVSGICYLLSLIKKDGCIDVEIDESIYAFIVASVQHEIQHRNYEFLYGLMGLSTYLCSEHQMYREQIQSVISFLDFSKEIIEDERNMCRWAFTNRRTGLQEYNLSMSHGLAAIIALLVKFRKLTNANTLQIAQIDSLLNGTVHYLLSQQIDVHKFGSFFPYTSDETGPKEIKSRLGWCYGDLGSAIAIYQAGRVLCDQSLQDKAVEILLYASKNRRDVESNSVNDAGICHGTAGIAQVFYRMWWNTHLPEFKDAADYWFSKTLDMAIYENGLAGYKTLNHARTWVNCDNLLEGISGIGLAFLFYLHNKEPFWDECILLS